MFSWLQGKSTKSKILLAVSAAILYGLFNWAFVNFSIPGAPVLKLRPQIALPIAIGLVYGPLPGFLTGFLGNAFGDFVSRYGLQYWNWSIGNGLIGAIPGLVYLSKMGPVRTVSQFGVMELAIVGGNAIGLATATFIGSLVLHQMEFQDAIWNWLLPGVSGNMLLSLALVPLLLIVLKKIALTIETRTILVISVLLIVAVLAATVVLIWRANTTLNSVIASGAPGLAADVNAEQVIVEASYSLLRWAGMVTVFVLLVGTFVSVVLVKRLTSPVSLLCSAATTIGSGTYETSVIQPVAKRSDELGELARTFENMVESLKRHIEELKKTTAAKERIESELRVATEIQMSMLPRVFPPFPDRKEFDIFASMEPAKEVGGDLYDFFFAGPDKLCFVIGDVCDKGVPAALFMAITKALLRTAGSAGLAPDAMLAQTNDIINPENDASMFATVFCATLDSNTGELRFANAGHPPPLLNSNVNGFQYMEVPKGFVVGPMPGVVYTCQSLILRAGEAVFLYTDGVTEAANGSNQFYSEARLQEALTKLKGKDATAMVKGVRKDVKAFVGSAPQNDDITMVAIRFLGKPDGH